ncbi:MAG: hypothetical protein M1819_000039 [Sarea resinae]|nr:MAG: hypothetical protein M1819_000039 [Sarea resinae]
MDSAPHSSSPHVAKKSMLTDWADWPLWEEEIAISKSHPPPPNVRLSDYNVARVIESDITVKYRSHCWSADFTKSGNIRATRISQGKPAKVWVPSKNVSTGGKWHYKVFKHYYVLHGNEGEGRPCLGDPIAGGTTPFISYSSNIAVVQEPPPANLPPTTPTHNKRARAPSEKSFKAPVVPNMERSLFLEDEHAGLDIGRRQVDTFPNQPVNPSGHQSYETQSNKRSFPSDQVEGNRQVMRRKVDASANRQIPNFGVQNRTTIDDSMGAPSGFGQNTPHIDKDSSQGIRPAESVAPKQGGEGIRPAQPFLSDWAARRLAGYGTHYALPPQRPREPSDSARANKIRDAALESFKDVFEAEGDLASRLEQLENGIEGVSSALGQIGAHLDEMKKYARETRAVIGQRMLLVPDGFINGLYDSGLRGDAGQAKETLQRWEPASEKTMVNEVTADGDRDGGVRKSLSAGNPGNALNKGSGSVPYNRNWDLSNGGHSVNQMNFATEDWDPAHGNGNLNMAPGGRMDYPGTPLFSSLQPAPDNQTSDVQHGQRLGNHENPAIDYEALAGTHEVRSNEDWHPISEGGKDPTSMHQGHSNGEGHPISEDDEVLGMSAEELRHLLLGEEVEGTQVNGD